MLSYFSFALSLTFQKKTKQQQKQQKTNKQKWKEDQTEQLTIRRDGLAHCFSKYSPSYCRVNDSSGGETVGKCLSYSATEQSCANVQENNITPVKSKKDHYSWKWNVCSWFPFVVFIWRSQILKASGINLYF